MWLWLSLEYFFHKKTWLVVKIPNLVTPKLLLSEFVMESIKISECMRKVLARYDDLRGRDLADTSETFWDLVVITAGDSDQEAWYRDQLEMKQQMGDLPLGFPIIAISDPPGPRIGTGGSTMRLLDHLLARC